MMRGAKPQLVVANAPIKVMPSPPDWLAEEAKVEWRRSIGGLVERGILTEGDMANFENYCTCQGRIRAIEADLQRANSIDLRAKLFRIQDKSMQTAKQLAAELGLTPISRSRPAMQDLFEGGEDDPLDIS